MYVVWRVERVYEDVVCAVVGVGMEKRERMRYCNAMRMMCARVCGSLFVRELTLIDSGAASTPREVKSTLKQLLPPLSPIRPFPFFWRVPYYLLLSFTGHRVVLSSNPPPFLCPPSVFQPLNSEGRWETLLYVFIAAIEALFPQPALSIPCHVVFSIPCFISSSFNSRHLPFLIPFHSPTYRIRLQVAH